MEFGDPHLVGIPNSLTSSSCTVTSSRIVITPCFMLFVIYGQMRLLCLQSPNFRLHPHKIPTRQRRFVTDESHPCQCSRKIGIKKAEITIRNMHQPQTQQRLFFPLCLINSSSFTFENNWVRPLSSCLLYTSPSPRDGLLSRMPSSA